ncbi:MAG: hypothetical protein HYV17_16140 [Xanthomonadales bacterium]|nr:hypothetical protein [Xanthomonadales bacterium]
MALVLQVARIAELLPRLPADAAAWLSPSEQERLVGLRVPARREQYLAGHWLAREQLAALAGGVATAWQLQERRSLPPAVVGHEASLHLSLSHSGDWIAAAVADTALGIDLEQRRPREALHRFEELLLAEGEVAGSLDNDALLQRWVVKEAWIKRDHGSALPEHLAAIRLHHAEPTSADLRLWNAADFHLALATLAAPPWQIQAPGLASSSGWRVVAACGGGSQSSNAAESST